VEDGKSADDGKFKDGRKSDEGGAGDKWSIEPTGRSTWRRLRHDLSLRRMNWELDEERARKNAIYWTGRADHIRIYTKKANVEDILSSNASVRPVTMRIQGTWCTNLKTTLSTSTVAANPLRSSRRAGRGEELKKIELAVYRRQYIAVFR